MSTSSDLKVGEAFKDAVYIITTATGVGKAGLAATCNVIDEAGNAAGAAAAVDEGNGIYSYEFTPDAAGTWKTVWDNTNSSVYTTYGGSKIFKVGTRNIAAVYDDTNELQTDWTNGGRLDNILDAAATTAALATVDGFHDVPAQNGAGNAQMRDVVGNKTDTTAGNSLYSQALIMRARTDHHLVTRAWFSNSQEEVAVTNGAGDKTLPSVTLPNITGTIVHVYAGFKFRMLEDTSAVANKLSGAQEIQVRSDAPGAWADAINFVDDQFGIAASTREGGDCVIGSIDLVGTVTAFNDTYEFQWDEAVADGSNLQFNDVQTFLIVSYY